MRRQSQAAPVEEMVAAEETAAALVALTYELLDAHADTGQLALQDASDIEWRNHLDYLRDLQRVAREALAQSHIALPKPAGAAGAVDFGRARDRDLLARPSSPAGSAPARGRWLRADRRVG